jgi:hypothetical protein
VGGLLSLLDLFGVLGAAGLLSRRTLIILNAMPEHDRFISGMVS